MTQDGSSEAPSPPTFDWQEVLRTGVTPYSVRAIQVETSSICNFRCDSCPLSRPDYDRPERHMTLEDFRRVLDAFGDLEKLELQGLGEVFLNPCVVDIVQEAVGRGITVHTFSNASKIDRETARGIVRSGLSVVNLSMDGADEPTFRKLRKGGTLKRFLEGARNLLEERERLGSSTPTVGIMTVLSKANYRQIPRMLEIAEDLGVETIIFTKLNAGPKEELEELTLGEEERAWIAELPPHEGRAKVVWGYTPWTFEERVQCPWPHSMAYVTVEGDVTPCCNYYDSRELKLGNVFERPFEEIWQDQAYRDFRRRLMSGDLPHRCRIC